MTIVLGSSTHQFSNRRGPESEPFPVIEIIFIDPGSVIPTKQEDGFRIITNLPTLPDEIQRVYSATDQIAKLLLKAPDLKTLAGINQMVGHGFRGDYDLIRQCPSVPIEIFTLDLVDRKAIDYSHLFIFGISYEPSGDRYPYLQGRSMFYAFTDMAKRANDLGFDFPWQSTLGSTVTDRWVIRNQMHNFSTGETTQHDLPVCVSKTAFSWPNDVNLYLLLGWKESEEYAIKSQALDFINRYARLIAIHSREYARMILVADDTF